ncbi:hypothetical protein K1W54_04460 [Micromonospora sp. CPCC 205371]|nr:hypothetical protein [Micromonospora sp. CPCC 205371]
MLKTVHRPVPLPNAGAAEPVTPPTPVRRKLPPGASHWSRSYYDESGKRHNVNRSVPVTESGELAAHEYDCPQCPDDPPVWLAVNIKTVPHCDVHGIPLTRSDEQRKWRIEVPFAQIWDVVDERVRVAALTAAVGAAGVAVDQAQMPWWGHAAQLAAIPAAIAGSWWATKVYLTRQARLRGTLDPNDEVAGKRRRRLIARRARIAGYSAAVAGMWVQLADLLGVDFTDPRGPLLAAALAGAGIIASRPYLRYVDDRRGRRGELVTAARDGSVASEPVPDAGEQLRVYVTERWQRICGAGGPLPGTVLEDIHRTVGGWAAVIVATDDSDLDPEKFGSDKVIGRVARAYSVGTSMVSITRDPVDANRAHILVQKASPLAQVRGWDGAGIDPETGRAFTATLDDGTRIEHTFWRPGWGALMELIAGCTGSGKSEYLNLLLALERQSGRVVSWVGDPQMGQTLGDIRDGVDWFAPTVEEILTMLRVAVTVMLARNLVTARMRVLDEQGRERRVKYREVSEAFPLLSITIDEAHLPMGDPDHGREIVKLLSLLAKAGRKCNVKVRLITQSPLLEELKSSVLRSQVISGLVSVFRTTDRVNGKAAWPGKMPADPADLPDVWPDGSTTAGLMYQSGQKPLRARTDYAGDVYDLMHAGVPKGLEAEVLSAAGVLYADRRKRLDAFDALDPAELLGLGIPTIDLGAAKPSGSKQGGRDALLRFFADRWLEGDRDPVPFGQLADAVRDVIKTRACTDAVRKLVEEGLLVNDGGYALTDAGAELLGVLDEVDA